MPAQLPLILGEALGVVLLAFLTWLVARARKFMRDMRERTEALHDEVRTNHGKPARDYIEMIEEVRDDVRDVRDDVRDVKSTQKAQHIATAAVETNVAMLGERVSFVGQKADQASRLARETLAAVADRG